MLLFRIYLATSSKVSLCKITKLRWSTLVINEKQMPEHMSDISSLSRVLTNTFPENFGNFRWENVKLRSSRPEAFCEKGVLRNFTKFTGKNLCQRLWPRCFPVNFVKFLRTFSYRTPLVAASEKCQSCFKDIFQYLQDDIWRTTADRYISTRKKQRYI